MQEIQFDYYRGMEAEQYTFYRIPKVLFTAECFKSLSCEAKVLYGLLLDRMSLSIKNRWFDEEDRVYIIFTVEEIMELMCCKTQKAVKLMKELDSDGGIGLIEKRRLGLGKPNVIYVKNFLIKEIEPPKDTEEITETTHETENVKQGDDTYKQHDSGETKAEMQNFENQKSRVLKIENQEFPESKFQNFENQKSGVLKIENQEFPKSKIKNFENHTSGNLKIKNQEFRFSKSNNTDINDTEYSETEYSDTDISETGSDILSINLNPIPSAQSIPAITPDTIEEMEAYRDTIREHISYECFQDERCHRKEDVDELVELMVEVMLLPDNGTLRIAGVDKPVALVKNRFMKLNQTHIEYILTCLGANTTKVGNIKAYLLTTLYNAPTTISNYYTAEVNHDLYGSG
ncbi:replication initiator protein A [Lachnospiraceae bacterium MD308]|nr:replication initiator protein A [Lachnospiraceae bacterium MD308]